MSFTGNADFGVKTHVTRQNSSLLTLTMKTSLTSGVKVLALDSGLDEVNPPANIIDAPGVEVGVGAHDPLTPLNCTI